ncbi:NADPH dehydrogenase [Malassezia caprae]|uniref:NADPH dehydrogenase n=1 Tax=Malassezia caprae TaxID=1381934 RepID=A0AAF0IWN9_9BASI|nr:NADPH dehydrogenase [Malassezia caprae]
MADVWISRKRWTCKYCQVTINDDPPSRRHHESGMRHKHNVERALRALHRDTDAQRRADQEKQRAMQRIEQAAAREHARYDARRTERPIAAPAPSAIPRPEPARRPAAWKPSDKMSHYTTAASLGLQDEAPAPAPRAASHTAEIGAWETVAPAAPAAPSPAPAVAPAPVHEERQAARDFALVERSLSDDDDDDLVPIVTKRQRAGDTAHSIKVERDTETKAAQDAPASDEPTSGLFRKRKARGPPRSVGVSSPSL